MERLEDRLVLSTLTGVSFQDSNANGVQDAGEAPIVGATVYLDQNNNEQLDGGERATTTDVNGVYTFPELAAGEYVVRQVLPSDTVQTTPTHDETYYAYSYALGGNGRMHPALIDPGSGQVERLGTPQFARLHGLVRTNDGEFYGLNGFNPDRIFQLDLNSNQLTQTGTIGSNAAWGLAYDPSSDTIYSLVNDPSDGLLKLATIDRATGQPTFLGPGTSQLTGTSGLAFDTDRGVVVAFDNADDQFWQFDTSGNPTLLWDTSGLDGWGFTYNGDEFLLHARRVDDGNPALFNRLFHRLDPYNRTRLPGYFTASEAVPMEALEHYRVESAHLVYVDGDETESSLDFGTRSIFGQISGTKFDDLDGDGVRDAGEGGLEGVTIYLDLNDNGVLDTNTDGSPSEPFTLTGADGNYTFRDVQAGSYVVREVVPAGYQQTYPATGETRLFATVLNNRGENEIRELDPRTGSTLNVLRVPGLASFTTNGLAFDGERLYALNSSGLLLEVDPDSGAVLDTMRLSGGRWDGAAVIDGLVYANNPVSPSVIDVVDPATNSVVRRIDFGVASNNRPFGALGEFTTSDGRDLLLGPVGLSNRINLLDPQDGSVVGFLQHGFVPGGRDYGLTGVGGEIYVGFGDFSGTVQVYDESNALQRTLRVGQRVTALAANANSDSAHRLTVSIGQHVEGVDFGNYSVNSPPTADAGGPYEVEEGGLLALDGSGSSDPDESSATLAFQWDLDGDQVFGETGSAAGRGDEVGVAPTFSAAGLDGFTGSTFEVALRVTDSLGATADDTATISIRNADPTADDDAAEVSEDGPAATIDVLDGDTDPAGPLDPLTITGLDTTATTGTVTFTPTAVSYDPAGQFEWLAAGETAVDEFGYSISDGDGGTAAARVAVTVLGENDAPQILALNSSAPTLEDKSSDGQVAIDGAFADVDLSDTHTVTVDWGDGSGTQTLPIDQVNDTFAGSHSYAAGGIYEIVVTVDDGLATVSQTVSAVVTGVGLVDGTLYAIGTNGKDIVNVLEIGNPNDPSGTRVKVIANLGGEGAGIAPNGSSIFLFDAADVQRIEMHLCAGDDHASLDSGLDIESLILGGEGDDHLTGGAGLDVLIGGSGRDTLRGQGGHDVLSGNADADNLDGGLGTDILLGGTGGDRLQGGDDNDLLLGGETLHQLDPDLLQAALAHWSAGDLNEALLDLGTLSDDNERDDLRGDLGDDVLLGGSGDKVKQ